MTANAKFPSNLTRALIRRLHMHVINGTTVRRSSWSHDAL